MMKNSHELSVVIPVTERYDDIVIVYNAYKAALDKQNLSYEIIYVLDGDFPSAQQQLSKLATTSRDLRIIKLARSFGEATALHAGFRYATGQFVMTLPAYFQVEPAEINKLITEIQGHDMVIARRWPRGDPFYNRLQTRVFHLPIRKLTGLNFQDLGCGARIMKRKVIEELELYGDQHRFIPLLAYKRGFRVKQIDIAQAKEDTHRRIYAPGIYLRRLLDILSVFFLLKFTKKPMRFFGLIGSAIFGAGFLILLFITAQRLIWAVPLADRPMLLLGSLLVVLGIQVFAIGLVSEVIIFTHAKDLDEYTIEEIIN